MTKKVFYKKFHLFFHYMKMDNTTYYQRNTEIILNKAKGYYKNNNERLREQARNKYRNLSEKDKNTNREYGKNRYRNMSEEKKQELKEYLKQRYREVKSLKIMIYNYLNIAYMLKIN